MTEVTDANSPNSPRRVVIDPVTRVEGHGKVVLMLDQQNQVQQARFHIVEFRGFEKFIQGRPYWELPMVVQRLCGICPVSHQLAAGKAIDQLVGAATLTPSAEKLRRLLHFGQVLQSHALHFFHLASPDLLFGFNSPVEKRNIFAVLEEYPDFAMKGVKMRRFGQEVIKAVTGKKIHGLAVVPGGMNKHIDPAEIADLTAQVTEVISWSQEVVNVARDLYLANADYHDHFAQITSPFMGLVDADGGLELYDGNLRVKEPDGQLFVDQFDPNDYTQLIREQVKSWSYMKFPYLIDKGHDNGWYRVGPLARINTCDRINTPLAELERQRFLLGYDSPRQSPLAYHWARMIELLHCAEAIAELLPDNDLQRGELTVSGTPQQEGIGVIEAPRGTLFHHYKIDDQGLVTQANLIVSTTSNNQAMNESIRQVAADQLDGQEMTPELLNQVEVAIRAYDPCLSCATHAVGSMPLRVEIEDAAGQSLASVSRDSSGNIKTTRQ